MVRHTLTFLKEYLRSPATIGAVAPSSSRLARRIVDLAGVTQARVIVEYGPGTGSFTRRILHVKQPDAVLIAIEFNPQMAQTLRRRFPNVDIENDSVENLAAILARRGIDKVDSIVSGLPWAAFNESLQDRLLDVTLAALRPGGRFATFAYLEGRMLPRGRRFRNKIRDRFSKVHSSPIIWRNLPPAFVYQCTR